MGQRAAALLLIPFLTGCSQLGFGNDTEMYVHSAKPLRPLMSNAMVGKPLTYAVEAAGAAPMERALDAQGAETLVWVQADRRIRDGMAILCRETISARNGMVISYLRTGC